MTRGVRGGLGARCAPPTSHGGPLLFVERVHGCPTDRRDGARVWDRGPLEQGISMKWDYVIVCDGSDGCVLANRLTEDGRTTVLVLEAGGEDRSPFIRVPAGVLQIRSKYGWH